MALMDFTNANLVPTFANQVTASFTLIPVIYYSDIAQAILTAYGLYRSLYLNPDLPSMAPYVSTIYTLYTIIPV